MKIVPLNCPNCSASLEIGENKDQLACGTCGSQLYVDRSGGTISLELAKSLGAISTGATQTAAELALVRLEKERTTPAYEVYKLESEIKQESARLIKQDIMSENAVASAQSELKLLNAEKGWMSVDVFCVILAVILVIIIVLASIKIGNLELIILFAVPAFILWLIIVIIYIFVENSHKSRLDARKRKLEEQIGRHNEAQRASSALTHNRKLLPDAREKLARIDDEIAHNKKIVSLKH